MKLYNIKDHSEQVSFCASRETRLGSWSGSVFPEQIAPLADVNALLEKPLVERSSDYSETLDR